MAKDRRFYGTGRRKSSVARVILIPGKGKVTVKIICLSKRITMIYNCYFR